MAALTAANTSLRAASTSAFEPFDVPLQRGVGLFFALSVVGRVASVRSAALGRGLAARFELQARRFAAGVERCDLRSMSAPRSLSDLDLLPVEGDLLLQPPDLQLARVRRFARGRRLRVRLGQLRAAAVRASLRPRRGAPRPPFRARARPRAGRGPSRSPRRAARYRCANCTFSQRRSSSRSRL